MSRIPDKEIEALYASARANVRVSCCEYHAHSAASDCLSGPEKDVAICKLVETIHHYEGIFEDLKKTLAAQR